MCCVRLQSCALSGSTRTLPGYLVIFVPVCVSQLTQDLLVCHEAIVIQVGIDQTLKLVPAQDMVVPQIAQQRRKLIWQQEELSSMPGYRTNREAPLVRAQGYTCCDAVAMQCMIFNENGTGC